MAWVQGQHLDRCAESLLGQPKELAGLREKFRTLVKEVEAAAADNVKRVIKVAPDEASPYLITAFMELKTVWPPIGV